MQYKVLYRFKRADGGITVSPDKPNCSCTYLFRIIAAEGKAVTKDGVNIYSAIDTENTEGYYEVENPETETETETETPIETESE